MDLSELVAGEIITTRVETSLHALASMMENQGVGSVAIVDKGGDFVGLVTDRDIVRAVADDLGSDTTAADVMTNDPDTIDINTDVSDAVAWMNATGYRHLPVTRSGKLVGMISIKDLLWAVAGD